MVDGPTVVKLDLSFSSPSMCSPFTTIFVTSPARSCDMNFEYGISFASCCVLPNKLKMASSTNMAVARVSRFLYRWFNAPPGGPGAGPDCGWAYGSG